MPQSREHPDNQDISHPFAPAHPVASQGNVHIVPEPASQGHMPPPPEFRDAFRAVGIVEILRETEAEHPSQADGHVGIPGKIEVNVQHKGKGVQPGKHHRRGGALPVKISQQCQIVRQNHLFGKADHKPPQTQADVLQAVLSRFQLPGYVPVADNRPGNQLREQSHIGSKGNEIPLRLHLPPVHVHGVAQALEGIKADAHGQSQLQKGQAQAGKRVEAGKKKVRVFE